jgi:hypothetical protein
MRVFKTRKLFLAKPCFLGKGRLGLPYVLSTLGEGFTEIS